MKPWRAAGVLGLLSLAAAASAQAPPPAPPSAQAPPAAPPTGASAPAPRVSPLLGQVLERVVPAAPAHGEPGLFRRLAQQQGTGAGVASLKAANAAARAPASALVPALGYAMEQLDPASFAVLRPVPVGGSGALLRTGDVFVLQFSTSLPGRVRLENIDPKGRATDLGTYTVFVDQLNRLPRDKGIQLQGPPGLERLRFYFYPCLPAEAVHKPWAADFQGQLPGCTTAPLLHTAAAGAGTGSAQGTVAPRALVNLNQPDAHLAFAGSHEYQPGELTVMEAQIRHEGRSHGR